MPTDDAIPTIYALASAPGRAAIAVIRLSGPEVRTTLEAIAGRVPPPRRAARVRILDPGRDETIDDGLVLFFPAPNSYTGEDVAELHLHGSRAVLTEVFDVLGRRDGLRLAEPGEFTRRAFENGKLDLTEAEAVADLIAADTAQQRRQAMTQLEGALGMLYEDWRGRLMRALARLEAEIDFPDEGLPPDLLAGIRQDIAALGAETMAHLDDRRRGERTRDGVSVAILGPPNSGKSSLLNWLARRDVAITSEIAGTTRDIIEVHLDLGGFPLLVADTAGLRETADAIEREGVKRALARAEAADIRIILLDATRPDIAVDARLVDDDALVIVNKVDLVPPARGSRARFQHAFGVRIDGSLSIKTGEGMTALLNRLTAEAALRVGEVGAPPLTRARHREALEHCVAALGRFEAAPLPELAAEDLRQAARSLGRITGRVDVEDMLDILFRDFCIGK